VHHLTMLDELSVIARFTGCRCRCMIARRAASGGNNMFRILAFDGGFLLALLVCQLSSAYPNGVISASRPNRSPRGTWTDVGHVGSCTSRAISDTTSETRIRISFREPTIGSGACAGLWDFQSQTTPLAGSEHPGAA
jgi:hypothetical protein